MTDLTDDLVSIAHSPDTDDELMFWALRNGQVGTAELKFTFKSFDTATLNDLALQEAYDVVAISAAVYRRIHGRYLVLPHGASVGRGYGPVIVSRNKRTLASLGEARLGIPGKTTTAALLTHRLLPNAKLIEFPITPYEAIFAALDQNEIEAALLIHEGQLEYRKRQLSLVIDLGEWWNNETLLPLPLGLNVIRRSLGETKIARISQAIHQSISWGLANLDQLMPSLITLNRERGSDTDTPESIREYLKRYVNADTLNLDHASREALSNLLSLQGEPPFRVDFAAY